ncbi:MAG: hypothetical protein PHC62_08890 [Candidatus Izemoplasmatales bacterium]|jgi:hypothetical protein|nr:hypothetical protein [Candidatus Izemoplasmatales bacterium]
MISQLFEVGMMICFGFSWPIACVKAYNGRTTKGISIYSVTLILTGYAFGITYKILNGNINYVIIAYILNFTIVSIYALIYIRNYKIEKKITKI